MKEADEIFHHTLTQFLSELSGKNRSPLTIRCYGIDCSQFLSWIQENDLTVTHPADITKAHLSEYLASLSDHGLSGRTRARKLAAIKEYFRFLVAAGVITTSPAETMSAPKRERNGRTYLTPEEYTRLLSLAGYSPRDYAILQVFLQTGIRVSELCSLTLSDVDLADRTLTIHQGKGMADRTIELEKKGLQAIRNYLRSRPQSLSDALFLNYQAEPISERGVQKLLQKYVKLSGITKKISPHSLRHTFATYKAERGVSPYQLQQWLGHRNLNTTQIDARRSASCLRASRQAEQSQSHGVHQPMRNQYRFSRPPKALIRQSVKLDNVALVPGSLLPFKNEYQQIANGLHKGGILIVLPHELSSRRVFEQTAVQLKNKGNRIATISATRFLR